MMLQNTNSQSQNEKQKCLLAPAYLEFRHFQESALVPYHEHKADTVNIAISSRLLLHVAT